MNVHWLEQTDTDVPSDDNWLSARERVGLSAMRFAKRRNDWRLGRWTAKRAVAACLHRSDDPFSLADVEILSASSGAPEVHIANCPAEVTISLSHRTGTAICCVASSSVDLGCDLEAIEARSTAFFTDYFTAEEQALVSREAPANQSGLLTLLWSGKESALKALHTGLRLDTRSVVVTPQLTDAGLAQHGLWQTQSSRHAWHPLQVTYRDDRIFHGWWKLTKNMVHTLVACPPPEPPSLIALH